MMNQVRKKCVSFKVPKGGLDARLGKQRNQSFLKRSGSTEHPHFFCEVEFSSFSTA